MSFLLLPYQNLAFFAQFWYLYIFSQWINLSLDHILSMNLYILYKLFIESTIIYWDSQDFKNSNKLKVKIKQI